jgi:hypothetical protein
MANNNLIKYGLIIGGGGLAAWGLTKLANFKDTADKLTFNITSLVVGSKKMEYISLLLNLEFVNPSNQAISLSIPSIKPYYGESELGYSVPLTHAQVIAPGSISKITGVEIRIPTTNLLTTGLIKDLLTINFNELTETLKQKIYFKIFAVVNGLEVAIEQRFGEEAKELGHVDEVSGLFEGLGLVAAGKRAIEDGSEFNHLFPEPKGTNERVQNDGDVNDTVLWCGYVVKTYHSDTKKLAGYLQKKSNNKKDLFRNIFEFCYKHIQYHLDRKGVEELRRPAVTWKDRKHGVDCDDFTMFIASILYNLNIPFGFRITKYNKPNYQHIYLIVPIGDGAHITIDPVLDTFNYEKPYSQKKDYDMKALNLAGNRQSLSGPEKNIGIPIEILAGFTHETFGNANVDVDLLKVVFGEDLQGVIDGLGSTEDDEAALLRHLKRLRNIYVKHPDYIEDFQDPKQAVEMLDYAIKYWDTPKRQEAIERLAKIEDELIAKGQIKLAGFGDDEEEDSSIGEPSEDKWEEDTGFTGVEPELAGYEYQYFGEVLSYSEPSEDDWEDDIEFSGTEPELAGYQYRYEEPEWEEDFGFTGNEMEDPEYEYDYSVDGLAGKRRRKRKAKRAQRRSRRKAKRTARRTKRRARRKTKGGIFKRVAKGLKKGVKKVARGIMKVSAAPMRIAFLAALRTNMGKVSDKLKYAYLTEQRAIAMGIDRNEYRKLKNAHKKVENMFFKMGGNRSALKRAILSGKRKNLRGFEVLEGTISGIDGMDGFEQDLGFTGNEPENPGYEYKYDNQVWELDTDFSGYEGEYPDYEYDYSFNGLDGRAMRFRKRRRAKNRYFRKRERVKRLVRNAQVKNLLNKIQLWLNDVDSSKLVRKQQRKKAFLKALYHNYHNISIILAQGYLTQSEAASEGVPAADWQKIRLALDKTKNLFKDEFNGNETELKKAILLGENKPNLEGLGAAVAAASAAAGLIGKIVGWIKDIRLKKKAKKEAKKSFKASGGTNEQWRQSGKQQFNTQWQQQAQMQKSASLPASNASVQNTNYQSQPNTDFSSMITSHLKSGAANLVPENNMVPTSHLTANTSSLLPATTDGANGNVKQSAIKAFLTKHKKKLLIGGGVLGLGALGYALYKNSQKEEGPPTRKRGGGVSGTSKRKKTSNRKNVQSRAKKIIEVEFK